MENMEIDQVVVDIPDTPDRVTAQHINGSQFRKERSSPVAGHSRNSNFFRSRDSLNESSPRGRTVSENGYNRRLHLNHGGVSLKMDESEPRDNNSTAFSSQNFPLFRRGAMVNNFKLESRPSASKMQHLDKGKAQCNKVASKSPVSIDEDALFNIALSCGASKAPPVKSSKALKGKEKVDLSSRVDSGSEMNHGRGNDSSCDPQPIIGKQKYPSFSSPRVAGQKRLVRNGCISPYNIVSKTQNLAKIHEVDASNDRKVHFRNMVPDDVLPIKEIVAEEKNDKHDSSRARGKGVMIYPSTSMEHTRELTDMSTRPGTNQTASKETSNGRGAVLLDGWRSTRNHSKSIFHADEDEVFVDTLHESRVPRRNNGDRSVVTSANGSGDHRGAQTASRLVTGVNQISQPQPIGNMHTKRQKKHGLPSRNQNRGSKAFPEDSDIVYLGSSEESSTSRSSRALNGQRHNILDPIYEIDEPTPDKSRGLGSSNDEDEDARARQVEADEILARELQEEMYHESPIFGGSEVDENLAWVLQEDDDIFPTAFLRDNSLLHARNATTRANRQPQPPVSRNRPYRRGSQVRVPTTRTSQLRSRLFNRSPTGLPRSSGRHRTAVSTLRNFHFPSGMDIDMRLDILGALEDAVGEFNDLSMTATNIHHVQRDFNENDYEMLLALDDNIHQHGVSVNRINTLPETVVQAENFDECAICLETPSIGETIRHLPCFHKFHKECIDPWLSRRTSCPVCKSSIT
ncbi:RING/U-box superfamily protein [Euphorbia peplus]|nr:RING/U-box superfamily protein [Euphorbia peplus]